MKEMLTFKKKIIDISKLNCNVIEYIDEILKQLFELENIEMSMESNNSYLITSNDEKICNLYIETLLNYNVLKILIDNKTYIYHVKETNSNFLIELKEYNDCHDKLLYNLYFSQDKCLIHINGNDNYLYLEVNNNDKEEIINKVDNIDIDDDIIKIYKKIITLSYDNTLIIRKVKLVNISNSNEDVTDLLVLKNSDLVEFKMTINKENRKYVIERKYGEYKITFTSSVLSDFNNSYFEIGDTIGFIKKLEKKK